MCVCACLRACLRASVEIAQWWRVLAAFLEVLSLISTSVTCRPVTLAPGDLEPSSDLQGHQEYTWRTNIQAVKALINIAYHVIYLSCQLTHLLILFKISLKLLEWCCLLMISFMDYVFDTVHREAFPCLRW